MQNSELLSINIQKANSRKASIVSSSTPSSPHFIQNSLSHDLNDILRGFVDELCEIFIEARQRGKPDTNTCKLFTDYLKSQNQNVEQIFECLLNNTHRPEYTALLGYFYFKGIGTKPSFRKAYSTYLSEAKKDFFIAQDLVGDCYYLGRGTIKDCRMAFEWYQKAADNGSIGALEAANDSYKSTNKRTQKTKLQNNSKKVPPGKSKLSKAANTDSTRRSEPSNKNNSSSNNVTSSKNVNLHESPSESSSNNVNLHETPSESSNNVILYELFSESSVEDNSLSNSDHFHELSSKSEVIDLDHYVEGDLSLKTIDLRESSEEFSETIIPEPFVEPVETDDLHESSIDEPSEIIIPVETCSEPSIESEMSLKIRESPLPEELSTIVTPEPSDESNLPLETTDLYEPSSEQSYEQSYEQSSEIIIPITSCPEPSIETTDLYEISSEQSSEVNTPDIADSYACPLESSEAINQVTPCPESNILLEITDPHKCSPVESSEIINQETIDSHECSPVESSEPINQVTPCPEPSVEPSETTNQEPEPSMENNSSPKDVDQESSIGNDLASSKTSLDSEEFTALSENDLVSLLKNNNLLMEEGEIWILIIKWGIAQNPSLSQKTLERWTDEDFLILKIILQNCIPHIQFRRISRIDIIEKVQPYHQILEPTLWQDVLSSSNKSANDSDEGSSVETNPKPAPAKKKRKRCSKLEQVEKRINRRIKWYKKNLYDEVNYELLEDFPAWLRGCEMDKYAHVFEGKRWQDIVKMKYKDLRELGIDHHESAWQLQSNFWIVNCDLAAKKGKTLPYKGGVDRINVDLELLNDFPEYLKTINMEQYAPLFAGKNWKEIIDMDHKDLKALKIESVSHRIDMVKQFWVMRRKIYHTKRVNKCVLIPSKKRTKIPDMISEFEDPKEEEVAQSNEPDNKLE
ncbi:HCP-like protein [Gigaspora margarita]|uniref:HCP-like protein n=1 Tax=Gigaspora margarita TaxID=4874 RepID=A0A8H4AAZ5_GIGMA|nr:HCP-like protein [Gigaspora margarita]